MNVRIKLPLDQAERVVSDYCAGQSEMAIAKSIGRDRGVVRKTLIEAGVSIRTRSDAASNRHSLMTPAERANLAEPAHAAVRGMTRTSDELDRRARTKAAMTNFIGKGESELAAALTARDLRPIPQLAVGPYNIDIAVDALAVEVHNTNGDPDRIPAKRARIAYIEERGWTSVYVKISRRFEVDAIAEQVSLLVGRTRPDGTYRIIRGSGELLPPRRY